MTPIKHPVHNNQHTHTMGRGGGASTAIIITTYQNNNKSYFTTLDLWRLPSGMRKHMAISLLPTVLRTQKYIDILKNTSVRTRSCLVLNKTILIRLLRFDWQRLLRVPFFTSPSTWELISWRCPGLNLGTSTGQACALPSLRLPQGGKILTQTSDTWQFELSH